MELDGIKLNTWYRDEDNYYFYPTKILDSEEGEIECHTIDTSHDYEHYNRIYMCDFPNPVEVPFSEVVQWIPSEYSKDNYEVWN